MRPRLSQMHCQDPWAGHCWQALRRPSLHGVSHKKSTNQPGPSQKREDKLLRNKPNRERDLTADNSVSTRPSRVLRCFWLEKRAESTSRSLRKERPGPSTIPLLLRSTSMERQILLQPLKP